ncbi:MAG: transglutaminase family protein [Chloroflexota bacterium]|nr:transglutaminase family protein [Chloroflexota bacterium]
MIYAITHLTTFSYDALITDSVMEVRFQPRSDSAQRCLRFDLRVSPKARPIPHRDYLDNTIHQFDIPGRHRRLAIRAEAVVETMPPPPLPDSLPPESWSGLRAAHDDRDLMDMLLPSQFARPSAALDDFAVRQDIMRAYDPLTTVRWLNGTVFRAFEYMPNVTRVDSPIEDALDAGKGVCQDFTHILTTLARGMGIPTRYVSGYLFQGAVGDERDRSADDATHAWVECWFPDLGWIGFDPTNNLICGDRHIRVAVGRDYADVPPTKGVFRGEAESILDVSVKVSRLEQMPIEDQALAPEIVLPQYEIAQQQQ